MRYLSLGLFAEGATDHAFLQRVLYRATFPIAQDLSDAPVDIAEGFVRVGRAKPGTSRADAITAIFGPAITEQAVTLLFVHADGGSDRAAAVRDRIAPCRAAVRAIAGGGTCAVVAVVPVRETEAWALADVAALRATWGSRLGAGYLGLPSTASDVEKISDAKQTLKTAYMHAVRPRREPSFARMIDGLGDRIDLATLRGVPAFRECESEIRAALRHMWQLP